MRVLRVPLMIIALTFAAISMALEVSGTDSAKVSGAAKSQFLPTAEAFKLEVEVLESGDLRLYWQIAEAYYLYQHRFGFQLEDTSGAVDLAVQLPEGQAKTDEFFGDIVAHYHDADVLLTPARSIERGYLSVTSQGCADAGQCYPPHKQYFEVDFNTGNVTPTAPPREESTANSGSQVTSDTRSADLKSLPYMLLLAFLGGAILNLMPCVFPILSLKVLSFTQSDAKDHVLHSWIYTAGVVASFVLVAAVLIALQQAGQAIGWGFQLQSPGFVIALAYLFVAMGLSLSGVIEFGGSLMNIGSGLANRGGKSGSFFTGVLAVVVASPCTAPFMGTALGFAVSQPPLVGLTVFASLGAGMAAPLLLFSYSGAARSMMPKPGPWMETMKHFLAFPLYATAIWLLWVAGRQAGVDTMATALTGALMLALGLWLWDHRKWRRGMALACCVAAVTLGSMQGPEPAQACATPTGGKVAWSDHGVQSLRGEGKPVFVDVSADWCITCKANEAAVLHTDALTEAFSNSGVTYMVADWTNHDPEIAALLERHGRTGVPLYLMYPGDTEAEPLSLPQILTPGAVLEAIAAVTVDSREREPNSQNLTIRPAVTSMP
ncbi:MAG: protein-disulfide reductase DsbD [Gammaproteobacteria bacterium]|nr:protein-disulfide reductase DsbD [Gammaproteobacteria bacterium]